MGATMLAIGRVGIGRRVVGCRFAATTANKDYAPCPRGISKAKKLRALLNSKDLSFMMEAHNGLSAKIVEETGFKAIWAGSLAVSAAMGVRGDEEANWTQIIKVVETMAECTTIPILLDAGKHFSDEVTSSVKSTQRAIQKLETRGIAGVMLEDSVGRRSNSFLDGGDTQGDIEEFCEKLSACREVLSNEDFCVVASLGSLVEGGGIEDAY